MCIVNIMYYIVYSQWNKHCTLLALKCICFASLTWMEVENCVLSFSFKTDQTTWARAVYASGSVQTDYSWTWNRKILMKRALSLPLLRFPQDIYQLCAAVCVGFTAYITRTTFIKFYFSTWASRPRMKMKAEVEILLGHTFQKLSSVLVESKF